MIAVTWSTIVFEHEIMAQTVWNLNTSNNNFAQQNQCPPALPFPRHGMFSATKKDLMV